MSDTQPNQPSLRTQSVRSKYRVLYSKVLLPLPALPRTYQNLNEFLSYPSLVAYCPLLQHSEAIDPETVLPHAVLFQQIVRLPIVGEHFKNLPLEGHVYEPSDRKGAALLKPLNSNAITRCFEQVIRSSRSWGKLFACEEPREACPITGAMNHLMCLPITLSTQYELWPLDMV